MSHYKSNMSMHQPVKDYTFPIAPNWTKKVLSEGKTETKESNMPNTEFISHYLNTFHLSPHLSSQLEKHYLLHWTGGYLASCYDEKLGVIVHQDVEYIALISREQIKGLRVGGEYKLSFRKPKQDILVHPVVLIRSI